MNETSFPVLRTSGRHVLPADKACRIGPDETVDRSGSLLAQHASVGMPQSLQIYRCVGIDAPRGSSRPPAKALDARMDQPYRAAIVTYYYCLPACTRISDSSPDVQKMIA